MTLLGDWMHAPHDGMVVRTPDGRHFTYDVRDGLWWEQGTPAVMNAYRTTELIMLRGEVVS